MLLTPRSPDAAQMPGAAHDRVYRTLRSRIMHGEILPGTVLTLRGIGKDFDTSMTPAREAARRMSCGNNLKISCGFRSIL